MTRAPHGEVMSAFPARRSVMGAQSGVTLAGMGGVTALP